jgi:nitroreductase
MLPRFEPKLVARPSVTACHSSICLPTSCFPPPVRCANDSILIGQSMTMQFVVVTDPAKRAAIGEIYGKCFDIYRGMDGVYAGSLQRETAEGQAQQDRVTDSAEYLAAHMGEAPALVIACTKAGRLDGAPAMSAASSMGNVLPAMWSFMLAARARGLGTCWTTVGLMMEEQIADVVGIPFDSVQQAVLSPLAYTKGTDFKTAMRPDPDTIIHWNTWSS